MIIFGSSTSSIKVLLDLQDTHQPILFFAIFKSGSVPNLVFKKNLNLLRIQNSRISALDPIVIRSVPSSALNQNWVKYEFILSQNLLRSSLNLNFKIQFQKNLLILTDTQKRIKQNFLFEKFKPCVA